MIKVRLSMLAIAILAACGSASAAGRAEQVQQIFNECVSLADNIHWVSRSPGNVWQPSTSHVERKLGACTAYRDALLGDGKGVTWDALDRSCRRAMIAGPQRRQSASWRSMPHKRDGVAICASFSALTATTTEP